MVQHGVLGRGCSACCCGGIVVVVVAGVLVVAVAVAIYIYIQKMSPTPKDMNLWTSNNAQAGTTNGTRAEVRR